MARCFISRKSFELENEVRDLRRRLANREASSNAAVVEWPILTPGAPCEYIETFLKKKDFHLKNRHRKLMVLMFML